MNEQLERIPAFRQLSPRLATSGQPDAEGIVAIARAGFKVLLNLAPPTGPSALADEAALASRAGLHYLHLPIDVQAPDAAQADEVQSALRRLEGEAVFIHGAAQAGVSGFLSDYLSARLAQ